MTLDNSMKSLNRRLQQRAKQLERSLETAVRQGAMAGLRAATVATPVDTGNARVNWNVSVKDPKVEVRPLPEGASISKGEANRATRNRAAFRVRNFRIKDGIIWLTNGVKYIKKLDTGGHSKKGGQMSAKAILAATRAIKFRLSKGVFPKTRRRKQK